MEGIHTSLHEGIILHRRIDQFIDSHEAVVNLNRKLYDKLPRVSGITIDIVFDHLLALEWKNYHHENLHTFLDNFFHYSNQEKHILPSPYVTLLERLQTHQMLHQYHDEQVIDRIANHLNSKLSFESELPHSRAVYHHYQTEFKHAFQAYMKDAVNIFLR